VHFELAQADDAAARHRQADHILHLRLRGHALHARALRAGGLDRAADLDVAAIQDRVVAQREAQSRL
jgi:hypothetical protein